MDINSILNAMIVAAKSIGVDIGYEELNEVISISTLKIYKKKDVIRKIGDNNDSLGFLLSGLIRSYYIDEEGNESTKYFHIENSLFMDEGLVNYEKSRCVCEALEDCTVIIFPVKKIKEIVMKYDSLKQLYITVLENGIRYKIERENLFLTCNATARYLNFIKEYPTLLERVNQSYIATYLGITPESLSRIRRSLANKGE